jgi:hypothetical protein
MSNLKFDPKYSSTGNQHGNQYCQGCGCVYENNTQSLSIISSCSRCPEVKKNKTKRIGDVIVDLNTGKMTPIRLINSKKQ